MTENLKTKTVLVYDYGLFTELAATLLKAFGKVLYFVPWQDDFPSSKKQKIGMDFKGITRVQDFYHHVDEADLIICFDTYTGDLVSWLRKKGKRVWGAGEAESMELERWKMRVAQKQAGLPVQDTLRIKSLDDLILYFKGINRKVEELVGSGDQRASQRIFERLLGKYKGFSGDYWVGKDKNALYREWMEGGKEKFVKANMRGDIESFYVPNYDNALSKFNHLSEQFGHRADAHEIEFVIEEKKDGVEPGFDGIQIDGAYLSPTMYGYERKGAGYVGRVCDYTDLPKPMRALNLGLSGILRKYSPTSSFFSNEFLIGKDRKPYLIDPTVRNPAPVGSAIYCEMIQNLGEILWNGAEGKTTPVRMAGKYAAGVCLDSEWAKDHELEVEIEPSIKQFVKFRKAYEKNGKFYALPGFTSICSVIAIGNSVDEVIQLVKDRIEKVHAYELSQDTSGLDGVKGEIEKGLRFGIGF
jgi:hypothetical protein